MLPTTREDYYNQLYVLHEICRQLQFRYLNARRINKEGRGVLTRYYLGYKIDLLKQSLEKLNVLKDETIKLYFDLAKFRDENGNTPLFSFNSQKRKEDKERFNKEFKKYMVGFDFAIDLDSDKDIKIAWNDAKKIKKLFDDYKLPYSCKFSGSRGLHFLIEDRWFNNRMNAENKVILFGRMANVIMNVCGLKSHNEGGTFDDSIYDDRRIFKLAYSLNNNKGIEYVCLPLSDEQFNNFKIEDMKLANVIRKVQIFQRGLLERNHGLTEKQLKTNVSKFLKEMK